MKTILLAFLCMTLCALQPAFSQPCSISNFSVEKLYTGADGKCYLDLFFDLERNSGNKFLYVHLWSQANFLKVDKSKFENAAGPDAMAINGSAADPHPALATLAIDNRNQSAPVWSVLNYQPDASVAVVRGSHLQIAAAPVSGSGANVYRYAIKGVPLEVTSGGCVAADINGILWATQSNSSASDIHCSNIGKEEVPFPLEMSSMANCASGLYEVRLNNPTGKIITGSLTALAGTAAPAAGTVFNLQAYETFDVVDYFLVPPGQSISIRRSIPVRYIGKVLFSHVALSDLSVKVQMFTAGSCGLLPVKFVSFTARRSRQQVALQWQTTGEENVRGFNLLRRTGSDDWKVVAFLPSQASSSNPSITTVYHHTDLNPFNGVSQYRVEEVAVDGKTSLSDVKLVRGEESPSRMSVFPNPSTTGTASLVFDHSSLRDIQVVDMSGRIVRQWKGTTVTSLWLENLGKGSYTVQVIDRATNEVSVEKLVVK